MKYCPRCKTQKLLMMFWKCSTRYDGVTAYCIPCAKKYNYPISTRINKKRYSVDADFRKKRIEYSTKHFYKMSPEYHREYAKKNRDRLNETHAIWRSNNRQHLREYSKQQYIKRNLKISGAKVLHQAAITL